jgi:DNA-binding GntR family transcriptional regulator
MNFPSLTTSIARTSLADSVYETLLQAIVSGRLPSGTVLTSVDLAQQLDVSRTPVQEALRRLAGDGLVDCTTGRRATVASFAKAEIIEIYEMRRVLEGETAARAATRVPAVDAGGLRRQIESLLGSAGRLNWAAEALESDVLFHEWLSQAAGNRRLEDDIRRYRLLVRSFCRMVGSVENLTAAAREHLAILDAVERREGEAARQAMHAHIDARLDSVLREITTSSTGPTHLPSADGRNS